MKVDKTVLEGEQKKLADEIRSQMHNVQGDIDALTVEYQKAMAAIEPLRQQIRDTREKIDPLGELLASVASRRSRVKYFPQFATRHLDGSKDTEFFEFVRGKIGG